MGKQVEALTYDEATRLDIPTAEYQAMLEKAAQAPVGNPGAEVNP